jgi:hypothetical protein
MDSTCTAAALREPSGLREKLLALPKVLGQILPLMDMAYSMSCCTATATVEPSSLNKVFQTKP